MYLIIPGLNEAKSLPHLFEAIEDAELEAEILVIDQGLER